MLVLDAVVINVEDLSSLEEYLAGLGRKHRAVGVKLSSFSVGKEALPFSRVPDLRPLLSVCPPLSPPLLYPQKTRVGPTYGTYLLCDLSTALTSLSLQFFFSRVAAFRTIESKGAFGIQGSAQFLSLCKRLSQTNNNF